MKRPVSKQRLQASRIGIVSRYVEVIVDDINVREYTDTSIICIADVFGDRGKFLSGSSPISTMRRYIRTVLMMEAIPR
jgi:hypothetical protein